MLNRSAIILKLKQPALDWINSADIEVDHKITNLEQANYESTVYLIPDEVADNPMPWLTKNFDVLFTNELWNWYTEESMWPQNRTLDLFVKWFDYEIDSVVVDLVDDELIDEDF